MNFTNLVLVFRQMPWKINSLLSEYLRAYAITIMIRCYFYLCRVCVIPNFCNFLFQNMTFASDVALTKPKNFNKHFDTHSYLSLFPVEILYLPVEKLFKCETDAIHSMVLFCLSNRCDRGRVKVSHETGGTPVNGSCRQSKGDLSNKWKSDDGGRHFYKNTCPHCLDSPTISLNNYVNEPGHIVQLH